MMYLFRGLKHSSDLNSRILAGLCPGGECLPGCHEQGATKLCCTKRWLNAVQCAGEEREAWIQFPVGRQLGCVIHPQRPGEWLQEAHSCPLAKLPGKSSQVLP